VDFEMIETDGLHWKEVYTGRVEVGGIWEIAYKQVWREYHHREESGKKGGDNTGDKIGRIDCFGKPAKDAKEEGPGRGLGCIVGVDAGVNIISAGLRLMLNSFNRRVGFRKRERGWKERSQHLPSHVQMHRREGGSMGDGCV